MPLAIYMQGAFEENTGKMGIGVLRYGRNPVVALIESRHAGGNSRLLTGVERDVPIVATIQEARKLGARGLILGIAPPGGKIPGEWYAVLDEAIEAKMSLVNGLHDLLAPRYPNLASDQFVWDVRVEPRGLNPGTGAARLLGNTRVLTVGTDMAVGKMTAGLELQRSLLAQNCDAAFVATGQIGMVITGAGVPLDAVRVDFAAGAIEQEVVRHQDKSVVIIEGQGSLLHPASTSPLPLMRGSCPTHLLLVHRAGMQHLPRHPWVKVPPLTDVMDLFGDTASASGVFNRPKALGIALNTRHLGDTEALDECARVENETGLICVDPIRHSADRIARALLGT